MPNFTIEDLLLYLYNEQTTSQKAAIENELSSNWALKEKLQVLREAKHRIEKTKLLAPRRQTIKAILQYASGVPEISPN